MKISFLLSSSVVPRSVLSLKQSLNISLQIIASNNYRSVLNLRNVLTWSQMNWDSLQIFFLCGSSKTQEWHSCEQVSLPIPCGLSASSYFCPEIIPWRLLGKSKDGVVCSLVIPLCGFSGWSTRRFETSAVLIWWVQAFSSEIKAHVWGRFSCNGVNAAQHITWGDPDPSDLRRLCKSPLEGLLQGHSDCIYTKMWEKSWDQICSLSTLLVRRKPRR